MDSFTLSVMYETAVCEGGNSAISQGFEAETLRGRNVQIKKVQLPNLSIGSYYYKTMVDGSMINTGKLIKY